MRQPRLRQRELVVIFMLSAILVCSTVARILPTTACEGAAPTLATLRRSANVASAAEVVRCTDLSLNGLTRLNALAIPRTVTELVLDGNSISGLDDGEIPATVTALSLKNNSIMMLKHIFIRQNITQA
ncbi:unnamed protein product [Peronospora destructor]|uniref:Uncharacterized protein n=1 Tax=Peronospora destructor TaxID=86335 RepID=A0AAV0UPV3_9STRA|nr:unnamed protein product [Peronospora destructor]